LGGQKVIEQTCAGAMGQKKEGIFLRWKSFAFLHLSGLVAMRKYGINIEYRMTKFRKQVGV